MEPANLNPPPDDDARLAAFVRDNLPRLPDDGFSGRVLAALPPRARRSVGIEWALVALGAAAGFGVAVGQGVTLNGALRGLSLVRDAVLGVGTAVDTSSLALALVLAAGTIVLGLAAARLRGSAS